MKALIMLIVVQIIIMKIRYEHINTYGFSGPYVDDKKKFTGPSYINLIKLRNWIHHHYIQYRETRVKKNKQKSPLDKTTLHINNGVH